MQYSTIQCSTGIKAEVAPLQLLLLLEYFNLPCLAITEPAYCILYKVISCIILGECGQMLMIHSAVALRSLLTPHSMLNNSILVTQIV